MTRRSAVLLSRLLFAIWLLVPGAASEADACNFQGMAAASVMAYDGGVVSDHFGQVTNVDCSIHSRYMRLRSNTLENNQQVWSNVKDGDKALMSASIFDSIGFPTCSGQWSSGTKCGTTYLGVLVGWLDSDVSGLTQGGCLVASGGTTILTLETEDIPSPRAKAATAPRPGVGLSRILERPEGTFLGEEWAVLSSDTGEFRVEFASSDRFLSHVEAAIDRYRPADARSSTVLVVEAVAHPMNKRFMPTPDVVPVDRIVDWPSREGAHDFWFRAEMDESGDLDRLLLLDSSDLGGNPAVRDALEERLALEHADERRHRTIVFGRATVSDAGVLNVSQSLVLVPPCCCGIDESFCV